MNAQLGVDLVVEGVARAAGAGAQRVAALDHEAGDHAVEDDAVVERLGALGTRARVLPRAACPWRARRSCAPSWARGSRRARCGCHRTVVCRVANMVNILPRRPGTGSATVAAWEQGARADRSTSADTGSRHMFDHYPPLARPTVDADRLKSQAAEVGAALSERLRARRPDRAHLAEQAQVAAGQAKDWAARASSTPWSGQGRGSRRPCATAPRPPRPPSSRPPRRRVPLVDTAHDRLVDEVLPKLVAAVDGRRGRRRRRCGQGARRRVGQLDRARPHRGRPSPKKSHTGAKVFWLVRRPRASSAPCSPRGAASRPTTDPWAEQPWEPGEHELASRTAPCGTAWVKLSTPSGRSPARQSPRPRRPRRSSPRRPVRRRGSPTRRTTPPRTLRTRSPVDETSPPTPRRPTARGRADGARAPQAHEPSEATRREPTTRRVTDARLTKVPDAEPAAQRARRPAVSRP